MGYRVEPGLYNIGQPDSNSPVLVTANYKLTVDEVRKHLGCLHVWLLILDTRGVNVWCASGEGTFGTQELVRSIQATGLERVVQHRRLVLPQLGAVGVAAHEVKATTGFSVRYGPVAAKDLSKYLSAGMKATPNMRRVTFGWKERLAVAPIELVGAGKPTLAMILLAIGFHFVQRQLTGAQLLTSLVSLLGAVAMGGVAVPLLLPWLPSRTFAVKGVVAGSAWVGACLWLFHIGPLETGGTALLVIAITSFMAMTFTGSTTFTNEAGARLEVRSALPLIIVSACLGLVLRVPFSPRSRVCTIYSMVTLSC